MKHPLTFRTASGDTVKLRLWNEWYQVRVSNGASEYTVFQSLSQSVAREYLLHNYRFPASCAELGQWNVPDRAQSIRRINLYP